MKEQDVLRYLSTKSGSVEARIAAIELGFADEDQVLAYIAAYLNQYVYVIRSTYTQIMLSPIGWQLLKDQTDERNYRPF